ncbi:MAG: hypothetical protein MK207_08975 [Saprospiraceae bacterium]|nr:hypothetical protein [Saprospiraceae bacterium]
MRSPLQTLSLLLFFSIFGHGLVAQIAQNALVRELPSNTTITINKEFTVQAGAQSYLLDSGKGKLCSCQFFTQRKNKTRIYEINDQFSLKNVTIKGLFDGSQMHVARMYFNGTKDYFKLKCYGRDILVKHISDYLVVGSSLIVEGD